MKCRMRMKVVSKIQSSIKITMYRNIERYILILSIFIWTGCKNQNTVPTPINLKYEVSLHNAKKVDGPIVVFLHGYGSHEKDLFGFAKNLDSGLTVVTPRAPITLQEGKYAWYNLSLNQGSSRYNFKDVESAKEDILTFIKGFKTKFGLENNEVYVGGFSQGAIMSLYIGLTEPDLIDGVIALSGHIYPEMMAQVKSTKELNDLNIFVSHGKNDNVLSFEKAEKGVQDLKNKGIAVDAYWYDAKHNITRENFTDMKTWLESKM